MFICACVVERHNRRTIWNILRQRSLFGISNVHHFCILFTKTAIEVKISDYSMVVTRSIVTCDHFLKEFWRLQKTGFCPSMRFNGLALNTCLHIVWHVPWKTTPMRLSLDEVQCPVHVLMPNRWDIMALFYSSKHQGHAHHNFHKFCTTVCCGCQTIYSSEPWGVKQNLSIGYRWCGSCTIPWNPGSWVFIASG